MLTHGYWHDFTVSILKCEEVLKIYRDHPHHSKALLHCIAIPFYITQHQITLERKLLWDVVQIDSKEVLMTMNGNMIHLPTSVIIPLRDKFMFRCFMRKRSLLLHIMLKQVTLWYVLDSKGYLLPPPCLDDSEI